MANGAAGSGRAQIVLGGIGADAHSIGLFILRHALGSSFDVRFLGIQNSLATFVNAARYADVVMVSSMDGHGGHYVRDFPNMKVMIPPPHPLFYIGGSLTAGNGRDCVRYFRELGFDRVFPTFVDAATVIDTVNRDLAGRVVAPACPRAEPTPAILVRTDVSDDQIDVRAMLRERRDVLDHWTTGAGARDLEDNAKFLSKMPSFALAHEARGGSAGSPLLQPRCGVSSRAAQLELFRTLERAGADVLSYQVDSLTRLNDYEGAEEHLGSGAIDGPTTLNGFPVVNHGVDAVREIAAAVRTPIQTRHGTRDPRLLAEISFAGGVTGFEGGAISYNIPYFRDFPLADSVERWQYVDRLAALYLERYGVLLDREFFGALTGTLIPPSLAIVVNLLEMLLAVNQGVRSISLAYAEQGSRDQDIAAVVVLREKAHEVLTNLGYGGVRLHTAFYQYMAAFPSDPQRARQLLTESTITAQRSGANRILLKTTVEAVRIPSAAENVEALTRAKTMCRGTTVNPGDSPTIKLECHLIRAEVDQILSSVVSAGGGSIASGIVTAFQKGVLDIPFSPSVFNRGDVLTARDTSGAVRFLDVGNLALDPDVRSFHRKQIDERRRREGCPPGSEYDLVARDVVRVARGEYGSWPLVS